MINVETRNEAPEEPYVPRSRSKQHSNLLMISPSLVNSGLGLTVCVMTPPGDIED